MREPPSGKELTPLLVHPPPGVDPGAWEGTAEGARLRWLKRSHHLVSLPAEQRELVHRLPYWYGLGPEDGLPPEWFNPRGYLLPVFRPGGGRHAEYRAARRLIRLFDPAVERAEARWRAFEREVLPWFAVGGIALVVGTAIYVQAVHFGETGWGILLPLAAGLVLSIGGALLRKLAQSTYYRCVGRNLRRRLGVAPDAGAQPAPP